MRLSEVQSRFDGATLEGEDHLVDGLNRPGEAGPSEAEIWTEGPVESESPVIVGDDCEVRRATAVLRIPKLRERLPQLLEWFDPDPIPWGIDPDASTHEDFQHEDPVYLGPGASVGPNVTAGSHLRLEAGASVRGNVEFGDHVTVRSGARIESPARIGSRTTLHANSVVGADGFGYTQRDGRHHKTPQIGRVVIGEDVEIGAQTTVDRATYGETRIGAGTKIDNLVHVGHNCRIGEHCIIIAFTGISGSVEVGDHVTLAGQVGVVDHVTIADRVTVASRGGVTKDITEEGAVMSGYPLRPHREELQRKALYSRLPQLKEKLDELDDRLDQLE